MTTLLARDPSDVNARIVEQFTSGLTELISRAESGCELKTLEAAVATAQLEMSRVVLGYLFALRCRRTTEEDIRRRELPTEEVRLRLDLDYWAKVMTTVGQVHFPLFAYRHQKPGSSVTVTYTPSRVGLFPYHAHCHSSPLCLEWETRLGTMHPFRRAEEELEFFTHGAVTLEDTTISRHVVQIGSMVDRSWLYRSPEEIREVLRKRATRDAITGAPLIYSSCDAHALRRYVDETWFAPWKMANGIRVWCEDRKTGEIIHIGGEFTWGDCNEVGRIFQALRDDGILPPGGNYGRGVRAQLVWVSDAMRWFDDHILSLFPEAVVILDIYHVLRWFAICAKKAFRAGTKKARELYARAAKVLGFKKEEQKEPKKRKGHKKHSRDHTDHAHDNAADRFRGLKRGACAIVDALLELLSEFALKNLQGQEAIDALALRLSENTYRMNYRDYLKRGYQIGSGAMESLHRTGSQLRTKLPGAKWKDDSSQAVFNLRMMSLVGKWDAFWGRDDLPKLLTRAFASTPAEQGSTTAPAEAL